MTITISANNIILYLQSTLSTTPGSRHSIQTTMQLHSNRLIGFALLVPFLQVNLQPLQFLLLILGQVFFRHGGYQLRNVMMHILGRNIMGSLIPLVGAGLLYSLILNSASTDPSQTIVPTPRIPKGYLLFYRIFQLHPIMKVSRQ